VIAGDKAGNFNEVTWSFTVTLVQVPPSVCQPCDINNDNVVDISDLVLVGKAFSEEGPDLKGDVNNDEIVDISDLVLVGKHFGEEIGVKSAAPAILDSAFSASTQVTMSAELTDGLYTISVKAQGVEDLSRFQFDSGFDENLLSIVKVVEGSALKSKGASYWLTPDIGKGRIAVASAAIGNGTGLRKLSPADDSVLAKITLKIKGEPQAALESVRLNNVKLVDSDGKQIPYSLRNIVELEKPKRLVRRALFQNYPNPFNPETWIPYAIAKDAQVKISVYNVRGQLVRTIDIGYVKSGEYTSKANAAYWDGKNECGERVASGVYFYTIKAGQFTATKRLVVLK